MLQWKHISLIHPSENHSQCEKIRQMHYARSLLLLHPRQATRFSTFVYLHKALLWAHSFFVHSPPPLMRAPWWPGRLAQKQRDLKRLLFASAWLTLRERAYFFQFTSWPGPSAGANPPSQTRDTQPGLLLFATCSVKCTGNRRYFLKAVGNIYHAWQLESETLCWFKLNCSIKTQPF